MRKTDSIDVVLSLAQHIENTLNTLEIKDEAKNVANELKEAISEIKTCISKIKDVGGFRIYKSLLTLTMRLTEVANSISFLLSEENMKDFSEKVKKLKDEIGGLKSNLERTRKVIKTYKKLSIISYIVLALIVITEASLIDFEKFFSSHGLIAAIYTLITIVAFTSIVLALNILHLKPKYSPVTSFAVMVLAPYSSLLVYTFMASADKGLGFYLTTLQVLGVVSLAIGVFTFLLSIGILINTTLPKIQAELSIKEVGRVEVTKMFKLEGKAKEIYEKLVKKYNEMFGSYGSEMLKYEIDSLILSGLSFDKAVRKIADRLNIHEETKTTEASGETNVNSK